MLDISNKRIIDLSLSYKEEIEGYSYEVATTVAKDGWNARWLRIYSHAGTHMDAPLHFGATDQTIDQFTPTELMGAAWVVRLGEVEPKQLIRPSDLGKVAEKVQPGDSLLIQTGWSKLVGSPKYRHELPRISVELAQWCVDKKIKLLGVEPPSVADVNNLAEVTEIHLILLGGGIIIVEGLCNLDKLTRDKVFFMALPLKIHQGDGAPARAIAIEEA